VKDPSTGELLHLVGFEQSLDNASDGKENASFCAAILY
jgi:hypothetical protein